MSAEDFDNSETEILTALNVTGGVLSLCGSIFIILTYYKYRELQKLSFKLIVFISIADFTTSLAKCFGSPATGTFGCGLQGFLTTFGDLASILWVFILSAVMYGIMFNSDLWIEHRKSSSIFLGNFAVDWRYIHGGIWITSLILALLPFSIDPGYSNTGGKCWISHDGAAQVWSWLCFYIWLWLVFIIIAVLYYKIYRRMAMMEEISATNIHNNNNNNNSNESETEATPAAGGSGHGNSNKKNRQRSATMRTANRIRWYPAVLFICFFWATFRRVWNFSGDDSPFWIVCLRVFFAALYGFCNAIVYGWTIYNNLAEIKASKNEFGDSTKTDLDSDKQEMTAHTGSTESDMTDEENQVR